MVGCLEHVPKESQVEVISLSCVPTRQSHHKGPPRFKERDLNSPLQCLNMTTKNPGSFRLSALLTLLWAQLIAP